MSRNRKPIWIAALLLIATLAGSIAVRRRVEQLRGSQSTLEEVLYLPSGKMVKRLSLGYSNLLADIYWTRAVQYFGSRHIQHSQRYDLLAPLLEITTDLDPNLIVAYENGSIFLSQQQPEGAGEPDKAVALVEKGIRNNPAYWRLYFTLGFIHYVDRHDYKAAQQAFQKGSEVPGAYSWMKVMAARMAEKAGEPATAGYLWKTIYDTTTDKDIRENAANHLRSLRAQAEIEELERRTRIYEQRFGKPPESWLEMSRAGLLGGIPADPDGNPYKLRLDGTVEVQDPSKFPYIERRPREQIK
jgi:tetratricopeptide (TPR) repeat protein